MMFAFSRDGAVPGGRLWSKVNAQRVPVNAVIVSSIIAVIITLPALEVDFGGVPDRVLRGRHDRRRRPVRRVRDPDLPAVARGRLVARRATGRSATVQVDRPDRRHRDRDHVDHRAACRRWSRACRGRTTSPGPPSTTRRSSSVGVLIGDHDLVVRRPRRTGSRDRRRPSTCPRASRRRTRSRPSTPGRTCTCTARDTPGLSPGPSGTARRGGSRRAPALSRVPGPVSHTGWWRTAACSGRRHHHAVCETGRGGEAGWRACQDRRREHRRATGPQRSGRGDGRDRRPGHHRHGAQHRPPAPGHARRPAAAAAAGRRADRALRADHRLHAPRRGEAVRGPRLPADHRPGEPARLAVRVRQRARRRARRRADAGHGGAGARGVGAHPARRAQPRAQPPDVPRVVPAGGRCDHAGLLRVPRARGAAGGHGGGVRRPHALHVQPGRRAEGGPAGGMDDPRAPDRRRRPSTAARAARPRARQRHLPGAHPGRRAC